MLNDLSEAAKCFIQFFDVGTASEAASGFGGDSCETDARLTVLFVPHLPMGRFRRPRHRHHRCLFPLDGAADVLRRTQG